jgi:hypothetical protein
LIKEYLIDPSTSPHGSDINCWDVCLRWLIWQWIGSSTISIVQWTFGVLECVQSDKYGVDIQWWILDIGSWDMSQTCFPCCIMQLLLIKILDHGMCPAWQLCSGCFMWIYSFYQESQFEVFAGQQRPQIVTLEKTNSHSTYRYK